MKIEFSTRPLSLEELMYQQRWEQQGDWQYLALLWQSRSNLSISEIMRIPEDQLPGLINDYYDAIHVAQVIQNLERSWDKPRVRQAKGTELSGFEKLIKAAIRGDPLP